LKNNDTRPAEPALLALARQAGALKLRSLPPEVLSQARQCMLDTLGCILAGSQTEEARLVLACESEGAAGARSASVYGTAHSRPLASALRINGYLGDVLELNDLIGGHASIGIVTVALGLAEVGDATWGETLEAMVRGIEVTARVYGAVYPSLKRFSESAMVPVGIPSSIGAAAAAARLSILDTAQTAHAMAIAGALAGWCPAEVVFGDGGTVKPMLFGAQPAMAGLTGADYAGCGMTGPQRLLESPLGYFASVSDKPMLDTGPWTAHWALARPRRKLHACCGYLHAAVDAVAQLHKATDSLHAAHSLRIHVPPYTAEAVAKSQPPRSSNDARFHLQYCVAQAWRGADAIEPDHSIGFARHMENADVRSAMERLEVVPDATLTHYQQCRVVALDRDGGQVRDLRIDAPRGSPERPLSEHEVVGKFRRLAAPVIGPERADRIAAQVMTSSLHAPMRGWLADLRTDR
jgi:2-methylcitrate dehydratase PrpD